MLYRKRVEMCTEVMWSAYGHAAGESCEDVRHQGHLIDLFFPQIFAREMVFMFSSCEHNILPILLFYLYRRTDMHLSTII